MLANVSASMKACKHASGLGLAKNSFDASMQADSLPSANATHESSKPLLCCFQSRSARSLGEVGWWKRGDLVPPFVQSVLVQPLAGYVNQVICSTFVQSIKQISATGYCVVCAVSVVVVVVVVVVVLLWLWLFIYLCLLFWSTYQFLCVCLSIHLLLFFIHGRCWSVVVVVTSPKTVLLFFVCSFVFGWLVRSRCRSRSLDLDLDIDLTLYCSFSMCCR